MMEEFEDPAAEKTTDSTSWRLSVDNISSEELSSSLEDLPCDHDEDGTSSSDGSSRLGWPLRRTHGPHSSPLYVEPSNSTVGSSVALWDEKREKRKTEMSEVELMKERFAKLLLGEDMSGRGKGVSSALAISNAITNLSASVFGEIWRLEPLSVDRKAMWRREMEWFLSVADHVVELVPSRQTSPDGNDLEVMVPRLRSDLHINLPALRKLDAMLLESLETFSATKEFWYVEQGIAVRDEAARHDFQTATTLQRHEEKWWLPCPRVPVTGLSNETIKQLKHQRDCANQILKAALAINDQTLSEMEVPILYWDSLPKNSKASIGEFLYKQITAHRFSPEAILCSLDLSTEYIAMEIANRIEAAILAWRRKRQRRRTRNPLRHAKFDAKASWALVRDFVLDQDRREFLAERAQRLLLCLKQKFPDLPQSLLDMSKIQYNRDVGQSILESYSRVIESLAYNIVARIDDVLHTDEIARRTQQPQAMTASCAINSKQRRARVALNFQPATKILSLNSL